MALISKASIAEVNSRLDAISVVGDYIRLEKKGGRWWGRCPFHGGGQEKTPSFTVDPDSKLYYCFGCNKGGSVISFVMEMEKISYPEAIKTLAKKTGVELIFEEGNSSDFEKENSAKEELYELYKRTTITFQHFLTEKPEGKAALNYIRERGISDKMIEQFKLGFAPYDRDFLYKFLQTKGYSGEFLEKSGLFSSRYKTLPLFSGRLMFPITDRQGKIVAFGGRAMPNTEQSDKEIPKYINSPETEIYKKGQTLFAVDFAKPQMRQTKTVYIAEGYVDVIALHEAGISNSVAPLGTAFTDEQAAFLKRWAENIVLIFDNDEAGHKAAYKSIITCRKNGLNCSLLDLQNALKKEIQGTDELNLKDPAEILQKFGGNVLKNILKFTINDFEYLIFRGRLQNTPADGNVIINRAVEFMFSFLDALDSEIDRDDCITRIADIYKIERNAVQKEYSQRKFKTHREYGENETAEKPRLQIKRNDELSLLTNVAVNTELYVDFRKAIEIKEIEDRAAKELFIVMEECFKRDENKVEQLLSVIEDENLRNYVAECATSGEYKGDTRRFMEDGIKKIKIKRLERRITEINAEMREDERLSHDSYNIDELLAEKKYIDSQILKLKGK